MGDSKLLDDILSGNTVLFMGSGASAGSILEDGSKSPLGNELAAKIYQHFYPTSTYSNEPLTQVSSFVQKKYGPQQLHDFLYDYLKNIKPSVGLQKLVQFKWFNVYTTNIEQALEEAYKKEIKRGQKYKAIVGPMDISSFNRLEEVNIFKLHGCISRKDEPLVFSLDEYATSKEIHLKLFYNLGVDLIERPIIFIGYSMLDSNFQEVWSTIKKYFHNSHLRKLYYVAPFLKEPHIDYLTSEGFEVFNMTCDEFADMLIHKTLGNRKSLNEYYTEKTSAITVFNSVKISPEKKYHISENYEFPLVEVKKNHANNNGFYKGSEATWADIKFDKDGKRDLLSTMTDAFINWHGVAKFDFWIVLGKAGDGKTTFIKRLAYEMSLKIGDFVLFSKSRCSLDPTELLDLYNELKKPLVVIIDNLVDQVNKVNKLISFFKTAKAPILIIGSCRNSDWSIYNVDFAVKPNEFRIEELSDFEIDDLLSKLESNNSLGYLKDLGIQERHRLFKNSSDRILLVALRELTTNKSFDEIIVNEFAEIHTDEARSAYLYVCFIYQFRIKVSQSLLIRILKFDLNKIYDLVFQFTQEIIFLEDIPDGSDFLLKARHPIIAEIIVNNFLNNEVKKYGILQDIMKEHIPSNPFEKDLAIKMVHNSTISKLFPTSEIAINFYDFITKQFKSLKV